MNGRTALSCSTRVATADGHEIVTIEGLADGDTLHPVQEAFLAEGAMQCGYCTSGMIMAAVALLILLAEWWVYHRGADKPLGSPRPQGFEKRQ